MHTGTSEIGNRASLFDASYKVINRLKLALIVVARRLKPLRALLTVKIMLDQRHRLVMLHGQINDKSAQEVVNALLFLEYQQPNTPIRLLINSSGGKVHSAMAIIDMMRHITSPVHTACFGQAESAASVILSAGEKGHRCLSSHSRVMLHQPTLLSVSSSSCAQQS